MSYQKPKRAHFHKDPAGKLRPTPESQEARRLRGEKTKEERKKLSLTKLLREHLEENDQALAKALIENTVRDAISGESQQDRKLIFERIDGKPKEQIEVVGEITVVWGDQPDHSTSR